MLSKPQSVVVVCDVCISLDEFVNECCFRDPDGEQFLIGVAERHGLVKHHRFEDRSNLDFQSGHPASVAWLTHNRKFHGRGVADRASMASDHNVVPNCDSQRLPSAAWRHPLVQDTTNPLWKSILAMQFPDFSTEDAPTPIFASHRST